MTDYKSNNLLDLLFNLSIQLKEFFEEYEEEISKDLFNKFSIFPKVALDYLGANV